MPFVATTSTSGGTTKVKPFPCPMSAESEFYITTYDGQPFFEEELFSLWSSPDWREWLVQQGYTLVQTTELTAESENKSVIIQIWQTTSTPQGHGEKAVTAYALYHSPLGSAPNHAGLYLRIGDQLSLAHLLAELKALASTGGL